MRKSRFTQIAPYLVCVILSGSYVLLLTDVLATGLSLFGSHGG